MSDISWPLFFLISIGGGLLGGLIVNGVREIVLWIRRR